jgi:hypothetical protein
MLIREPRVAARELRSCFLLRILHPNETLAGQLAAAAGQG